MILIFFKILIKFFIFFFSQVVVIFHETHHTDILTKDENKEPEDVLRLRFQSMNLSTEAYSAMEYVGTRTSKNPTSFDKLQACLKKHLNNSTVRSARHPFVIFNSLKLLNEKFSGEIDKSVPNTFPDQYFVCKFVCLSCNARCTKSMNHERDGIPHHSPINCKYQHQFNNQIFYCQDCFNRGENKIVIPKVTSSKDQSWLGLVNYAWSGYILECKQCGIIYRSRQFWFGNKNPEVRMRENSLLKFIRSQLIIIIFFFQFNRKLVFVHKFIMFGQVRSAFVKAHKMRLNALSMVLLI